MATASTGGTRATPHPPGLFPIYFLFVPPHACWMGVIYVMVNRLERKTDNRREGIWSLRTHVFNAMVRSPAICPQVLPRVRKKNKKLNQGKVLDNISRTDRAEGGEILRQLSRQQHQVLPCGKEGNVSCVRQSGRWPAQSVPQGFPIRTRFETLKCRHCRSIFLHGRRETRFSFSF